jgi:DNA polymerase-3 subunit gamma/tau
MLQLITELEPRFKKSGQQQLLVETLLVRFALMDRAVEIEGLIRSIGGSGGSGGGASSGGSSSARSETSASPAPRREARVDAAAAPAPSAASGARSGGSPPVPRPSARADGPAVRAELADAVAVEIRGQHFELVAVAGADGKLAGVAPLEMSKLTALWDQIVLRLRATKPMLATALSHATPAAVTASGVVTIELDEPNDIYTHAIGTGRAEILAAFRERFAGVERVELRRDEKAAAAPPKRLTDEMVRAERVAALRKREPLLDAAIEALDLDVAD